MNTNFTSKGKRIVVSLTPITPKIVVTALAMFFLSLSTASAKNAELLNPRASLTAPDIYRGEMGAASLDIYLNAANSEATVNLNYLSLYNNAVSVSDMTGLEVMSMTTFNGSSVKLNINTLKAGMYIVKVVTADGAAVQHKMIVTNR